MAQCKARQSLSAYAIAFLFTTGFDPGNPTQVSQVFVLGSSPSFGKGQEQKSFVWVFKEICTSNPIIGCMGCGALEELLSVSITLK